MMEKNFLKINHQSGTAKGDLVYPLSQHIGASGSRLARRSCLTGQMIAEAGGFISAPIYATVSGTVKAIEQTCRNW